MENYYIFTVILAQMQMKDKTFDKIL